MKFRFGNGQWDAVAIAAVVLLAISFVFGGASREHALRLALVELAALPLIVLAGARLLKTAAWADHRFSLSLVAAIAAIPLVQLIPLPPVVWTALPGREQATLALTVAGITPGWATLSLTPDRTWQFFLALTPPLAMFLGVMTLSAAVQLRRLVYGLLALTGAGLVLGAIQIASGDQRFYLWTTTAAGNMVGFFANRNHLATLILMALPFSGAIAGAALRPRAGPIPLAGWLCGILMGLMIVSLAVTRSRTGVILGGPTLIISLVIAWLASGRGKPDRRLLALAATAIAALTAVGVFALAPVLDRFDSRAPTEGRFENWPVVAEAAQTYFPAGAGLGSFNAVYRSVEPLDRLDATFFNQAHNEYLETWLEVGLPGLLLIAVFMVWWFRRSWRVWRAPSSMEVSLQRACSTAILLVTLHSLADYPLRTETIAVIFAFCTAVLERKPTSSDRRRAVRSPDPDRGLAR